MSTDEFSILPKAPSGNFVTWPTIDLVVDQPLPGGIFLCIRHRMVKYMNEGDQITRVNFDKLICNGVEQVFIEEDDRKKFKNLMESYSREEKSNILTRASKDQKAILESSLKLRRVALDLFASGGGDQQTRLAIQTTKKMVGTFLKRSYVVQNLTKLQRYGKGVADHSVNVSILGAYLGLKMGYTSQIILEHLAIGGILHDLGKVMIPPAEDRMLEVSDKNFQKHPELGRKALEEGGCTSREVLLIVAQHHEYLDGSGYPERLKGSAIYDLTRIVTLANVFDNLVSECDAENMSQRQLKALERLENEYTGKLDKVKLSKMIVILKQSIQ